MTAGTYLGQPVSAGTAAGELHLAGHRAASGAATEAGLRSAFAAVAEERNALAERLRARGREEEAAIVAIGALIAADPALVEPAVAALRAGSGAVTAVQRAVAGQAALIAALPTPELAERAADVRQVASAVVARLASVAAPPHPAGDFILVQPDVDPADLIRLVEEGLVGAVSVTGGATSHAAIIARGLGVPMLTGVDPAVLDEPPGRQAILDAQAGRLVVGPVAATAGGPGAARVTTAPRVAGVAAAAGAAGVTTAGPPAPQPPRTRDGVAVEVLCNVASAAETRLGLARGAAGVGLLRTEIPFVKAAGWPTVAEHRAALAPVLGELAGLPAVVRLLDFSGDKIPPFLRGKPAGLAALLGDPRALADQLQAVLLAGRAARLSVMVPMVGALAEVRGVRAALAAAAAETGTAPPPLGIMVEVAGTAGAAREFGREVDFFSVGTNDLTSQVLGLDRADPRVGPALAADPRVLGLIANVVAGAAEAGITVSVCGDAAADPAVLPLLIGLGVRTLSVGAALVPQVAGWIAEADAGSCAELAATALRASSVGEVWASVSEVWARVRA
jgi:multiphosphoryl transfer protein